MRIYLFDQNSTCTQPCCRMHNFTNSHIIVGTAKMKSNAGQNNHYRRQTPIEFTKLGYILYSAVFPESFIVIHSCIILK